MNKVFHNNSCIFHIWRLNISKLMLKNLIFLSLFLIFNINNIFPQDNSTDDVTDDTTDVLNGGTELPPFKKVDEEAPDSIFDFKIGDSKVDFYLTGSWEANFVFTSGFLVKPGFGTALLDTFPGKETGFLFNQIPDLTLSVWLMNRLFVEFSVLGSFEQNSFLMGYQGEDDETLRHIYLGNRDINIETQ